MPNLLHLDSSADLATSRSRAVTEAFANAWRARGEDHTVTYRDLHSTPLPHLADSELHWAPRLRAASSTPPAAAEALQQQLLDELSAADVLLVGAPMYNYSLPSSLKAWIDHVHVLGTTASFEAPAQPLAGRPAVVVTSQGMAYDEASPTAGQDHATPVLEQILGKSLGMSVTILISSYTVAHRIPGMQARAEQGEAQLQEALLRARTLGSTITA